MRGDGHIPPRRGGPVCDDELWDRLQAQVLKALGVGIVACDTHQRMLRWSPTAAQLLATFVGKTLRPGQQLPPPVARAVDRSLATSPPAAARASDRQGTTAVYVSALAVGTAPVAVVVWLRAEALRDPQLLAELRRIHPKLSVREFQMIQHVLLGHRNQQIADHLGLSLNTVKSYFRDLCDALGVHSKLELLALVARLQAERVVK